MTSDLFGTASSGAASDSSSAGYQPLAARLRPDTLDGYAGQQHILAPGKPLRQAIERRQLHSMIFWGPPGVGKTELAKTAATLLQLPLIRLQCYEGLDEAKALREEAQTLLASYERKQREVQELADAIVAQAKVDADAAAAKAKEDLKTSVERRLASAQDQIASAQAAAVRDVRNTAVTVAIGAAQDVIAKQMTATDANKLIDAAIADHGRTSGTNARTARAGETDACGFRRGQHRLIRPTVETVNCPFNFSRHGIGGYGR